MAAKKAVSAKFYGTGRRKSSIARVYVTAGTGKITINKRDIDEYFGLETLKVIVRQPLVATDTTDKYDVTVNVHGGGTTGQAGAIRHGISRALLKVDADFRPTLKAAGFLTRDPRMKERKKYGLKAARRAPQFSKRQDFNNPVRLTTFQKSILHLRTFCPGVFFCKNCGTINKEDFTYKILLSSDYQEGDWNEQKIDNFKTRQAKYS